MASTSPASLVNIAPAPKPPQDPRWINAVGIPRAHGRDGGFAAAICTGCICALTGDYPVVIIGAASLLAGTIVFTGLRALASVKDWKQYVWQAELAIGLDLDGDGEVGEPERTPAMPDKAPDVWVKSGTKGNTNIKHVIPFASYREARNVARALLKWGVPMSRRKLVDANVMPDDPDHYKRVFRGLVDAGLVIENKGKPHELTSAGVEYFNKCLTPLPDGQ